MASLRFVLRKDGEQAAGGARPLEMVYNARSTTVGYVHWSKERNAYVGLCTIARGRFESDRLDGLKEAMVGHVEEAILRMGQSITDARRASR